MKMKKKPLTPFQEEFCVLYHQTNNAVQSYMKAYKNDNYKTASKNSYELLKRDYIKNRLKELQDETCRRYRINTERLIRENIDIAFSKLSDVITIVDGRIELLDDGDLDVLDGISFSKTESSSDNDKGSSYSKSTSLSVKRSDRLKALQELARLTGAYKETNDEADDKKSMAQKLLESLSSFKKKE